MSFTDPIAVAANSPTPALTLAVVQRDGFGSVRADNTNKYYLTVKHSSPLEQGLKKETHYIQLTQSKDATSPLTGGTSKQIASVSLSVSIPPFGWTTAEKNALVQALLDTLADSDVTIAAFNGYAS